MGAAPVLRPRLDARLMAGGCAGNVQVISLAISLGMSFWSLHYMISKMDPDRPAKEAAKIQKKMLEQRLGRPCALTPHTPLFVQACASASMFTLSWPRFFTLSWSYCEYLQKLMFRSHTFESGFLVGALPGRSRVHVSDTQLVRRTHLPTVSSADVACWKDSSFKWHMKRRLYGMQNPLSGGLGRRDCVGGDRPRRH